MSLIVAIKPGPVLGMAVHRDDGSLETKVYRNQIQLVWATIAQLKPSVLVVERFIKAGSISLDGIATVEIAGSLYAMAFVTNASLVIQSTETRKPFLAEAKKYVSLHPSEVGVQYHPCEPEALAHLLAFESNYELLKKAEADEVVDHAALS